MSFGCDRRRNRRKEINNEIFSTTEKNYRKICFRFNEPEKFRTHIRIMSKYVDKHGARRVVRVEQKTALL